MNTSAWRPDLSMPEPSTPPHLAQRRSGVRRHVATTAIVTWIAATVSAETVDLIRDTSFRLGFSVLAPQAPTREIGRFQSASPGTEPAWQLAQWHSRLPVTNAILSALGSGSLSNAAKWISLRSDLDQNRELTLGVDSRPEYGERWRTSPDQPWVHWLAQQAIVNAPPLTACESLRLQFEVCLLEAHTFPSPGHSRDLHAAQFQVVFTLNHSRKGSAGFGDYLWLVLPVYDDRFDVPPPYVAQDFAVTQGKLIFNPGGAALGWKTLRTGEWQARQADLRPWLMRALETAWTKGYLNHSRDPSDYRIGHINLGWEVPGLNRVAIALRALSLRATMRSTGIP